MPNQEDLGTHRLELTAGGTIQGVNFGLSNSTSPPSLSSIANPPAILEDTGLQQVQLSGISKRSAGPSTLQITATSLSPQIVNVGADAVQYTPGDSIATVRYTPIKDAAGQATIVLTVRDPGIDQILSTSDDSIIQRSFTVTIQPVNDPPEFSLPSEPTVKVDEDSGAVAIDGFVTTRSPGGNGFEADQALFPLSVVADRPSLFVVQPQIDDQGRLTFTPALNSNGVSTIQVTLRDQGGTANGGVDTRAVSFAIEVTPINDPPTITFVGNATAAADSGVQTMLGFAAGFNPGGGPDEAGQSLVEFVVSVNRPELFLALPTIDNSGVLRYTPAKSGSGVAEVTARVRDNGGVLNGGKDLSSAQTFTITITPAPDKVAPVPQLASAIGPIMNAAFFDLEVTFSEPVAGFELTDLEATNASLSDLRDQGGGTYLVRVNTEQDGTLQVRLPENSVSDLAGNSNTVSALFTRIVDRTRPQPTLTRITAEPATDTIVEARLQFGESIVGLGNEDFVLFNGQVESLTDLGSGNYSVKVRATSAGHLIIALDSDAIFDLAGNRSGEVIPLAYTVNSTGLVGPLVLRTSVLPQASIKLSGVNIDFLSNTGLLFSRGLDLVTQLTIVDSSSLVVTSVADVRSTLANFDLRFAEQGGQVITTLFGGDGVVDLGQAPATSLTGIDVIDLSGVGSGTLVATAADLARINGGNLVRVICGTDDRLQLDASFQLKSSRVEGNRFIPQFESGNVVVEVIRDPMWENPLNRRDVNGDGAITPKDALAIINVLNSGRVSLPNTQFLTPSELSPSFFRFYDVNGDNGLTPADALAVINELNRQNTAGEPSLASSVLGAIAEATIRRKKVARQDPEAVSQAFASLDGELEGFEQESR